jgi:acyl carrier protein
MVDRIHQLLDEHGKLAVPAASLAETQDLYAAGLTSFAAAQLMLALEEAFDVEFPEHMLNRRSFSNLKSIQGCLRELKPEAVPS